MSDPILIAAGSQADLPPGARKLVFVPGGEAVLLFNINGQFHAIENSCPHAGASLASGACEGHVLSCPAHGLKFNLQNGQCTASPRMRIPTHEVIVRDDALWLRIAQKSPTPTCAPPLCSTPSSLD